MADTATTWFVRRDSPTRLTSEYALPALRRVLTDYPR